MTPTGKSTSRTSSSGARKKAPATRARKPASANARKPSSESSGGSDAKDAKKDGSSKSSESLNLRRERTTFEWALLTVALAAIGTVIVGLFLYAGHKAGGEAELQIEVADTGKMVAGGPQVEVTVKNVGGSGAEEIVSEVKMGEETREVVMTRIPKDDQASAIVTFPEGTTGTPEGELLSYNTP
jgi:uncharacterized protein (TIGR02588 family)